MKTSSAKAKDFSKSGWIRSDGYKMQMIEGKEVREHRYIMEQFLGRKLCRSEEVHHINGNKLDNNLSNLTVLTRSEHASISGKAAKGISKPNSTGSLNHNWKPRVIKFCKGCFTLFGVPPSWKKSKNYCSRGCRIDSKHPSV